MSRQKPGRLKRHSLPVRLVHWANALCFLGLIITALALLGIKNYEINILGNFYSLNPLLGGTMKVRWLHRWMGLAFILTTIGSIIIWLHEAARIIPEDWLWLKHFVLRNSPEPPQGKLRIGQKLYFFLIAPLSLYAILSGIYYWLSWFDLFRPPVDWLWKGNLHDYLIIPFLLLFLPHVYLALIAYPSSFISMLTGNVPVEYARRRHLIWYQEETGND